MSDKLPCLFRSREEDSVSSVAADAQKWVKEAAGKTNGLTIGAQILKACCNLGYPRGHWRVRAAWNGEAECWSAKALRELEARYRAWDAKQGRLADAAAETLATLSRAGHTPEIGSHEAVRQARVERLVERAREQAARRRASDAG